MDFQKAMSLAIKGEDGRIGWPEVFVYRHTPTGEQTMCPPADETPYTVEVKDLKAYGELRAAGAIYARNHTGRRPHVIDNRAAPGA